MRSPAHKGQEGTTKLSLQIEFLVACHNRKNLTIRSINSLYVAASKAGMQIRTTLFDDGSTDGTAEEVSARFPEVQILTGDGSAFWAKSMATAEARVLAGEGTSFSHLAWLNDDVVLDKDALTRLSRYLSDGNVDVLVGAMRDPHTAATTYTGLKKGSRHPLRFVEIEPSITEPREIDTFNGNLVFVRARVARLVGGIDGGFAHALADIDYGVRARKLGAKIWLAPSTYGECPRNEPRNPSSIREDWKYFLSPKGGGHAKSMIRYLRRHRALTWPFSIAATYSLWWLRRLSTRSASIGVNRWRRSKLPPL